PVEVGGAARLTGPAGEAEGRPAETQAHDLGGRGPGVEEAVPAGDAGGDLALADVEGDVTGTEVGALDVGVGIGDDELLAVPADAVARLAEHLDGGFGQGSLVGHGDAHGGSSQRWV